jgi:hypothetical protein
MTEEDKGMLRDIFAGLAMNGWIINGDYSKEEIPQIAYVMADAMMEAREKGDELGIALIKKRIRKNK